MATTLASQLQAIRTLVKVEAAPSRRPFTRPSVLFDPKEAADIDIETVLNISLTGLDALISIEKRFGSYKNDLFSYKSKELDRDLLCIEKNERINVLIHSYLRLLSGHLHISAALKTLEYLIRRYKIYIYNVEELILCCLPYHETHSFVRVVQLLDLGNCKWRFLDGVKKSGAPPPRSVIVQQCIRDLSVLESCCNYASPSKNYQPCRPVIYFCTSVIVEILGCVVAVDDVILRKVLPFIFSGLRSGAKGSVDHKAGIFMVISLLVKKVTLAPKLVASLVKQVSELAREDDIQSNSSQCFRILILTLINLVQHQDIRLLPKKALDSLNEIRALPELLACLMKEFRIEKFVYVFLDSLIEHCCSEKQSSKIFISIMEALPLKNLVDKVVPRLLFSCTRYWKKAPDLSARGPEFPEVVWVEKMLLAIYNKYPSELRVAVYKALESKKEQINIDIFTNLFDGKMDATTRKSDSIMWLGLDHPKAEACRTNVLNLNSCTLGPFKGQGVDSKTQDCRNLQNAILRRLKDDDLTVVQAVLSVKCLPEILESTNLLEVLNNVLQRCVCMLHTDNCEPFRLIEASFPLLKSACREYESAGYMDSLEKFEPRELDKTCGDLISETHDSYDSCLNAKVLVCALWRFSQALLSIEPTDISSDYGRKWLYKLWDLFMLLAESHPKHVFDKHIEYIVASSSISPVLLLRKFFTDEGASVAVQISSLHCFARFCHRLDDGLSFHLLAEFPSLLVPMSSENQSIRAASLECIQALHGLWTYAKTMRKDGVKEFWEDFLGLLLDLMIQQRRLFISDRNFLSSYLTSLVSSSCPLLMAPKNTERFDQAARESVSRFILESSLKLSAYAKVKIISLFKGIGTFVTRVAGIDSLLFELLETRRECHLKMCNLARNLSTSEVELLCLLLEIFAERDGVDAGCAYQHIMNALDLNENMEDAAVRKPCIAVLEKLGKGFYNGLGSEMQDKLFHQLVVLFRSADGCVQNTTRQLLLRIDVSCSSIRWILDVVLDRGSLLADLTRKKKSKKLARQHNGNQNLEMASCGDNAISLLSSLLDILILKKDIKDRTSLVTPLFRVLRKIFEELQWEDVGGTVKCDASSEMCQYSADGMHHVEQTLLLALQDICSSECTVSKLKGPVLTEDDVQLLVDYAKFVKNHLTLNHVFTLLSQISRIDADKIFPHVVDILSFSSEYTISQVDSYSRSVFENLISGLVPCWLSKTSNIEELLQMFIKILPDVPDFRRLSVVIFLMRTLGEEQSLGSLLVVLFQSMASRIHETKCTILDEWQNWEYALAVQVCKQLSCSIWIHSLICFLRKLGWQSEEICLQLLCAMKFASHMMQDAQFIFESESGKEGVQEKLADLMEQVSQHIVHYRRNHRSFPFIIKKQLDECMGAVLMTITRYLMPFAYFNVISRLLAYSDASVRKKALRLLCSAGKDLGVAKITRKKGMVSNLNAHWINLDSESLHSLDKACFDIVKIIDDSCDDSVASLKVQAVSTLEFLGKSFPKCSVLTACLACVTKSIASSNLSLASCCLRTAGTLVSVLGSNRNGLLEFPHLMENVLARSKSLTSSSMAEEEIPSVESVMLSILSVMEAVIESFSGFLSPYVNSVVELVVLHPEFISVSSQKVKSKVCIVRQLLCQRIPVRIVLPPLLDVYASALRSGHLSLSALFEMLANIISVMDKSSIADWHAKIFDVCLQALDLRSKQMISIQDISSVGGRVNHAVITLTKKLTEEMFRPLFISSVDWAESDDPESESPTNTGIGRAISFYGLVNELAECHRSLFVPYFKYLVEGCINHLSKVEKIKISRKKKAKLQHGDALSPDRWHLRALVLSSLHKCFAHDRGSQQFLDSSNFQLLLKPVVSQLSIDPPECLNERPDVIPLEEVNELLVRCVGQMAVTAGNDFLLKSLNHEVLMQTRNEKMRSRMVGLRIIQYLLEHLKEEYLVFLPETIPFLGELLEDVELSVKTLAQEIIKQMESMSGESLRQYL